MASAVLGRALAFGVGLGVGSLGAYKFILDELRNSTKTILAANGALEKRLPAVERGAGAAPRGGARRAPARRTQGRRGRARVFERPSNRLTYLDADLDVFKEEGPFGPATACYRWSWAIKRALRRPGASPARPRPAVEAHL